MAPTKPRANAANDDAGTGPSATGSSSGAGSGTHNNGQGHGQTNNGKARRTTAAQAAAAAAAATAAASTAAAAQAAASQNPTLQWIEFERGVLHSYTRAFGLDEAGASSCEFARWILSQPGSVGLQSPTMQRRRAQQRQSKAQLANAVRKHFNAQGSQENDIVVDFLHKVLSREVVRQRRPRRMGSNARELDG